MSRLTLFLLGPPRIECGGAPVQIPRRKAVALIAYLALTRRSHSRDALATLFWPEGDQSQARADLRRTLSTLKKSLGEGRLDVDREAVGLSPDVEVWLDIDEFQELLAWCRTHGHPPGQVCPACLSSLAKAVALYRDDFLAGFTLRDSPGFDDWQFFQTQGLRAELASALERLARGHSAQGEFEPAVAYARRWVTLDPLHESAHRCLMRLHAWSGQRAAALRQYTECEKILQEELGVPPEEETIQLYKVIKEKRELPLPEAPIVMPITPQTGALHDRYRLDAELGRGGMGTVHRAHDTVLGRDVAIKVLDRAGLGTEGRARLLQEAQIVAQLNHPHIVTIYDVGETDGTPFIVMEFVAGTTLQEGCPEKVKDILTITRQVCAALEHAHAHGIVHRDLKPENVMIASDPHQATGGTAKLMDFGLARSVASRLTSEGTITGTVFYLAPELALGQEFDGRADLYALGVILYELTTGRLPFVADDPVAVISQHLHAPVVPPRARNDQVPSALDNLILRLLSKDPADRPASAAEVLQILDSPAILDRETAPAKELSVLERIERGRLVGRERELQEVRAVWNRSLAGQGQMLLISGEPGVGKTRLVRELVTQAQVSGGQALVGASYAEGHVPYGPFVQVVRRSLRDDANRDLQLPEFVLADLLTLAPTLRQKYSDIPPNPPLEPQAEQHRLYESVVAFCAALSERVPLMLVLEDVHWADSGTLAMLRHLARRSRRRRLLIVATYREVELDQSRPFQDVLLDLNREHLAIRLKLGRLSREGTEALLGTLFAEEITPEFLDGIYRETEGNPFFIEEVCKALVESGQVYFEDGRWDRPSVQELGIPQSVRVAIQSRVRVLPQAAQETLRLAAVLGREFDFETLVEAGAQASAGALNEEALIDSLEAAERAQLIEELSGERGGTFIYTHALFPATLVEGLSGLRRRRMHRQVMTAIERLRPDDLESLAHHALEGGDLQKGLDFSLRAAERALRLFASEEALFHYECAREIAESLDLPEQLLTIHEAIGDIQIWRDVPQSIEAFKQALNLATDSEKKAGVKSKIGTMYVFVDDERGLEFLEAAIDELNPETRGNDLAQAMSAMGRFHHHRSQYQQALIYLERARRTAEPLGEPLTLTIIYCYLAGAHQHLTAFERSMEWARRTIALGEQKNYPLAIASGYEYLAEVSAAMGKWQDALEFASQDRQIGEKTGALNRVAWAEYSLASAYRGLGDLPAAKKAGQKSLDMAEAMGDSRLVVLAGAQLSIVQTDLDWAETAEQNARNAVERGIALNNPHMLCTSLAALAYWHMQHGEWENAYEHLSQWVHVIAETDNRLNPLVGGPQYAETSLRVGKLEEAAEIVERTLALAREAPSPHVEALTHRVQAQILAAQGLWDEAARGFDGAIAQLDQLGSRLELGRSLYHRGQMQAKCGEADDARVSLARALEIFQDCSAHVDAKRTRIAFDALGAGA
jgi:DNA-binding SARP family transcriptional activator